MEKRNPTAYTAKDRENYDRLVEFIGGSDMEAHLHPMRLTVVAEPSEEEKTAIRTWIRQECLDVMTEELVIDFGKPRRHLEDFRTPPSVLRELLDLKCKEACTANNACLEQLDKLYKLKGLISSYANILSSLGENFI